MAGQPEIRIMTEFFNSKLKSSVCDVKMTPTKRVPAGFFDSLKGKKWEVKSISRGKEAKVIFDSGFERKELVLYFFKGGCWEWYPNEEATFLNPDYKRDHRFSLHFEDGTILSQQDQFHQSYWKWGTWNGRRSPDILLENNAWRKYIFHRRDRAYFKKPIFQVMTNKTFFNGFNTFTISEVLARTRFSPFVTGEEILSSEILREDLFDTCVEVLQDVYELGGAQFGIWKNPFGVSMERMNQWIQVYKNSWAIEYVNPYSMRKFYVHPRWKAEAEMFTVKYSNLLDDSEKESDI